MRVTRSPLALAALASTAIPGLDPVTVQPVTGRTGDPFEVALIEDTEHRRWVVRAPMTPAAGAQMDAVESLLRLLSRRLPFSMPVPRGFAPVKDCGRAAVYPFLAGRPLDWRHLPAASNLAADVGRAVAALHNIDRGLYEEASLPSYDADGYRTRRLAELDRAAGTGHVPTGLLARWEGALEEVSLWRFAPTPTHGNLLGENVLAEFDDESDAGTGRVRSVTGWEHAQVADPADDFASLVLQTSPEAFDTVLEAYAHARIERPDQHLERRARLAGELHLVTALLDAVATDDQELIARRSAALRRLDERTDDSDLLPPAVTSRASGRIQPEPTSESESEGESGDAFTGVDENAVEGVDDHAVESVDQEPVLSVDHGAVVHGDHEAVLGVDQQAATPHQPVDAGPDPIPSDGREGDDPAESNDDDLDPAEDRASDRDRSRG